MSAPTAVPSICVHAALIKRFSNGYQIDSSARVVGWRLVNGIWYNAIMTAITNARVSHRGQTSLPADLRHRWHIEEGGEIGFIDLGDAALIVPGGVKVARRELRRVLRDRYAKGLAGIDDPDLVDQ